MIAVLGRPSLAGDRDPLDETGGQVLAGLAALIASAAAAAGGRVELVGSLGDDAEGDRVILALARAGVGHAAVLRDPAGQTSVGGREMAAPAPRLDGDDVALGLGYVLGYQVLVLAEPLPDDATAAALEAARYHGAHVILVLPAGAGAGEMGPGVIDAQASTVFAAPADEGRTFVDMVGRYAAALDGGAAPPDAFATATRDAGWEPASA